MLFNPAKAHGIFMGLAEDGLNYGAQITLNYNSEFQNRPMLGVYVIIELGKPEEAVLGRITAVSSHGKLASTAGEDIGARSVKYGRNMPEDIKDQFLRYRCSVRILGLLRENGGKILFTPSARRLPHMGAKVAFAEEDVLQMAAGAKRAGAPIGFLAFGEFIHAAGHKDAGHFSANFILMQPIVEPRFDAADAMVARRTAVLARSGFGKSNLLKLLFTRLYEKGSPQLTFAHGGKRPVGTLVFDPDGDYFWPGAGANAPPGLCDISALVDEIVLATDRAPPTPYHGSFVVSSAKLDLRQLSPGLVLSCALIGERQTHRGTEALQRLTQADWATLIDAATLDVRNHTNNLSIGLIQQLCRLTGNSEASAGGIRNTMLDLVAKLHDPTSLLIPAVEQGLRDGKMVIVDLSLMRGQPATSTAAIIMRHIFEHNVREHTQASGTPFAVIALIEEAQKVLEGGDTSHAPFIEWVKEGRKYGLGSVLVTQQPGAIDEEILSQTDSFFVFHLVSGGDLNALKKANGQFSDDILATLLNEPIEGQGVFWSSAGEDKTSYPIPFRAFNFSDLFQRLPATATGAAPTSYAAKLRPQLAQKQGTAPNAAALPKPSPTAGLKFPSKAELKKPQRDALATMTGDSEMARNLNKNGVPLFVLAQALAKKLSKNQRTATAHVIGALTLTYGLYGIGWVLETKTSTKGNNYVVVVHRDKDDGLARLEAGESPLLDDNDNVEPPDELFDRDVDADSDTRNGE